MSLHEYLDTDVYVVEANGVILVKEVDLDIFIDNISTSQLRMIG
jgi:hypothetical protein